MEYEILKKSIEKVLQIYSKEISISSTFESELGADSIDMAQIFCCVEKDLGIKLPKCDYSTIETVGDALRFIRSAM